MEIVHIISYSQHNTTAYSPAMSKAAVLSKGNEKAEKSLATSLSELVQGSKNLPRRSNDVGSLHRSLTEIRRRAVDLRKYNKEGAKRNPYKKVHYLMMGKGITIEDMEDELRSIDLRHPGEVVGTEDSVQSAEMSLVRSKQQNKAPSTSRTAAFEDIGDYVNVQRHESILSAIEQSLSSSARDFDRFVSENVSSDWKKSTKNVESALQSVLKKRQLSGSSPSSPEKRLQKLSGEKALEPEKNSLGSVAFGKENKSALSWGSKPSGNILSAQYRFEDVKKDGGNASKMNPNTSFALRKKFELYAQVIYKLNEARQDGRWYPLCTVFADLSKHEMTTRAKQMHEGWLILRDFCREGEAEQEEKKATLGSFDRPFGTPFGASVGTETTTSGVMDRPSKLEERKFARAYYEKSLQAAESIKLRKSVVSCSRAYLESQFLDHVNDLYMKTMEAGKRPEPVSNVVKVQKFLELTRKSKTGKWKVENMTFVNLIPIWATLFYLMRAGCYDEALALVQNNGDGFQKLERSFPLYMKAYCGSEEHVLPAELQGRLANEFSQYFRRLGVQKMDPYKYAVYKLIGRCDLARRDLPSVTLTTEDWLWYHLGLVQEDGAASVISTNSIGATSLGVAGSPADGGFDGSLQPEIYRLVDLQKAVVNFGPSAFNGSRTNPLYLQVLLLTGQYERAVKYVFESSEIDAVHLAVTLAYYGLLRVVGSDENAGKTGAGMSLLRIDSKGFACIDYPHLIGHYVRGFKLSDPRVAAEYLFEICLCKNTQNEAFEQSQIRLCQQAVRELVLETREFVILLGRIDRDGTRIPGVIERRKKLLYLSDEASYLHHIAEKAARTAEDEGRPYDCILLYQLSEEYDTVLATVNSILGDFLASVDFRTPLEDVVSGELIKGETNIVKLARRLLKMYNGSAEIVAKTSVRQRETCDMLLQLVDIAVDFTSSHPDLVDILARVKGLELTPCSPDLSIDKIRSKAQDFNSLDESLAKNVPNVLIIEMSCISQLLYELQQGYDSVQLERLNGDKIKGATGEENVVVATNSSKEQKMHQLRQMSKHCMVYAGMVQYNMPQEVYRMLVSLEVDI